MRRPFRIFRMPQRADHATPRGMAVAVLMVVRAALPANELDSLLPSCSVMGEDTVHL